MIAAAIIAALLGVTQWRRQALLREARALQAEGYYLLWDDAYSRSPSRHWLPNWLWPVVPKYAALRYDVLPGQPTNNFRVGSKIYTDEEMRYQWEKASDRLRALGVESVSCDIGGKPGNTEVSTSHPGAPELGSFWFW